MLNLSRLVLGIQLVIAGVQLPKRYLVTGWKPLFVLIGPGMVCMWLATSLAVHLIVGTPSFLHALAIGACVTPTDPVLSNSIVHGKFADQNIPKDLQDLIIAESGTNDGLGYPFLFFALYLIKFVGISSSYQSIGQAMGLWVVITWAYVIVLSIIYGAAVGWLVKELLQWCERRNYVDRVSFFVSAIAMSLFVMGSCALVGIDEVLACFIAGNAFTWDDWFRRETEHDSLQSTIDMLLNVGVFVWYGSALPWKHFYANHIANIWQLIGLGIVVLLLRRLPWIIAMRRWIPQIREGRQAFFMGFFGPIGVSAVYYIFVSLDFIEHHLTDAFGTPRSDVADLGNSIRTVVWFLFMCSMVSDSALPLGACLTLSRLLILLQIVHGLSIPIGKMGYFGWRAVRKSTRGQPVILADGP